MPSDATVGGDGVNVGMVTSSISPIAVTADLHWGTRHPRTAATRSWPRPVPPPAGCPHLAGDVGPATSSPRAEVVRTPACRKALIPETTTSGSARRPPRRLAGRVPRPLPRVAAEHGFHYLDRGPLLLPDAGLAVVGSINWSTTRGRPTACRRWPTTGRPAARQAVTRGRHTTRTSSLAVRRPASPRGGDGVGGQLRAAWRVPARCWWPPPAVRGLTIRSGSARPGRPAGERTRGMRAWRAVAEFGSRCRSRSAGTPLRPERVRPDARFNIGGDYDAKRLLRLEWRPHRTATEYGPGERGVAPG